MKDFVWTFIIVVVIAGVSSGVTRHYFPKVQDHTVTDTVYVDREFETIIREEIEVPYRVTIYETEYDTIEVVRVERDTVFIETQGGQQLHYAGNYLTQFPTAPKFLQLDVQDGYVEFTGMDIGGTTQSSRWGARDEFQITLSDGSWVSYSGRDVSRRDFSQQIGLGYTFFRDWSPYISYKTTYQLGRFGVNMELFATEKPFATAGVYYEL